MAETALGAGADGSDGPDGAPDGADEATAAVSAPALAWWNELDCWSDREGTAGGTAPVVVTTHEQRWADWRSGDGRLDAQGQVLDGPSPRYYVMCRVEHEQDYAHAPMIGVDTSQEAAEAVARARGWVQHRSGGWLCPQCASDPSEITVYVLEPWSCNRYGFETFDELVQELRNLAEGDGLGDGRDEGLRLWQETITRGEWHRRAEFDGY